MQKRNLWLAVLLLMLATAYVIFFTDWFKSKPLFIHYTARPIGFAMRERKDLPPMITFGFEQGTRLTEIKVVSLADLATNNDPLPLWHLVSDSNSVPYENFRYGQQLRGMHPVVPGARAEPLNPNQTYRIYVQAGKRKGQHDFTFGGASAAPANTAASN